MPLQGLAPTGPRVDGPALARPGPRVLSHGREVPLGPIPAPPPERRADPPPNLHLERKAWLPAGLGK